MDRRWDPGVPNKVKFAMIDANRQELAGLTLSILIENESNPDTLVAAAGTWTEIGSGLYSYLSTAAEAVVGPIVLVVTAAGAIQQNLEYVCKSRQPGLIEFPYSVFESDGITPIEGVKVEAYTPSGTGPYFTGYTNAAGEALDNYGESPWLQPGTWHFIRTKLDVKFNNPDIEVVS